MFNKTLIAAAIAAMAISGTANAAISSGEMFLVAYDSSSQNTFVTTLDSIVSNAASFTGTSNLSENFAANANWTTFTGAAGYNAATTNYQVLDFSGSTTTGGQALWTTSNDLTAGTGTAGINSAYSALLAPANGSNFQSWLAAFSGTAGGSAFVSATATNGTGAQLGNQWYGAFSSWTTDATLGTNLNFFQVAKNGTKSTNGLISTEYMQADGVTPGVWNLSSAGQLTYTAAVAAVPEADSWAMLVAGLGLMGFIARRRVGA